LSVIDAEGAFVAVVDLNEAGARSIRRDVAVGPERRKAVQSLRRSPTRPPVTSATLFRSRCPTPLCIFGYAAARGFRRFRFDEIAALND